MLRRPFLMSGGFLAAALFCAAASAGADSFGSPDEARVREAAGRGPTVIPEMIRTLESSDDAEKRKEALAVLAHFGPRSSPAIPALLSVLKKADSLVDERWGGSNALVGWLEGKMAGRALAAIGKAAAEPLIAALAQSPRLSSAVAQALAGMGPSVVPQLLDGLSGRPPAVRRGIAAALGDSRPVLRKSVQALERLIEDPDWETRLNALKALGRMGAEARPAVPTLVKALDRPGTAVYAARALAAIGGEPRAAAEVLIRELRRPGDDWKQRNAAEALGLVAVEVPEALDALIEALRANPFAEVRAASARALGGLGPAGRAAVIPLIMATEDEGGDRGTDRTVQKESRSALDSIGAPEPWAVEDLMVLLDHRQPWARLSAAEALGRIGPPARAAVPALASRILKEGGWGGSWAKAIEQIGETGPETVAVLEEATRVRDPFLWAVPLESAYALASLGKGREAALSYFRKKFNSRLSSADTRIAAAEGLRRLGEEEPRIIEFLTAVLQRTAEEGAEPWVAERATAVLGRYGAKAGPAVPAIVRWLKLKSGHYQPAGLEALGAIGTAEARAALKRFGPAEKAKPARSAPAQLPRLALPTRVEALIHALRNRPKAEDRARSAAELGLLGEAGRPALFALILAGGDEPLVAEASAAALERLGAPEPSAVEGLQKLLYGEDPGTVIEAAKALGRIGPPAKEAASSLAFRASPVWDRMACAAADALGRIGADTPEVLKVLKESVSEVKLWGRWDIPLHAANALIDLGRERELVRSYFAGLLKYDALLVRLDGAEGLIRLGETEGPATAALADAISRGEPSTAERAVELMGRCGAKGDALVPALERRLERDGPLSGPVVAKALSAVGTPRALDLLRRRLR